MNATKQFSILGACAVVGAAAAWAARDYRDWVGLGPGGLPHTFKGWVTVTKLRLEKIDPVDTSMLHRMARDVASEPALGALEPFGYDRPAIARHPIPHRLASHPASEEMIARLIRVFDESTTEHVDKVVYLQSHFEKHSKAVTAPVISSQSADAVKSHGEIGHVHPSDGSMHMVLHPLDAARAIDAGWGELHPLSGGSLLPAGYLFVYPPRRVEQLTSVRQLLEAAIAYVTSTPAKPTGSSA